MSIAIGASVLVRGESVELTAWQLIPVPPVDPPHIPIVITEEQAPINEFSGPPGGINPPTLPLVKTGIVTSDGKLVA